MQVMSPLQNAEGEGERRKLGSRGWAYSTEMKDVSHSFQELNILDEELSRAAGANESIFKLIGSLYKSKGQIK